MGTPSEWRDFALTLADRADVIARSYFGGRVRAVEKPDGSPVTAADREIEATLRRDIRSTYPDHAILGEEEGGSIDPAVPTWVIDPIDATKNFMRGIPVFATLIGVVDDDRSAAGVVSAPAMGERWDAAWGQGARCNGERVEVSGISTLQDAHVLHGGLGWFRSSPERWDLLGRITESTWRTRGFGDFWMHLLVAGGMAEVAFEVDLSPWDVVAPACIVEQSGGRVTTWDGGPALGGGDVVATNGRLHEEMLALLSEA